MTSIPRLLLVPLLAALAMPMATLFAAEPADGLVAEYFESPNGKYASDMPEAKPVLVRTEKQINFDASTGQFQKTKLSENFAARYTGLVRIKKAGTYTFATESDDASRLIINDQTVVDNGGEHPMAIKQGTIELTAGDHELTLHYAQSGGEAGIKLLWSAPGSKKISAIPKDALFHKRGSDKIAWDKTAWDKRKGGGGSGKFSTMDHGPTYTGTIVMPWGSAQKGIVVTLDKTKGVHAVFDPELLSLCYGGVNVEMAHPAGRDGLEGQPTMEGEPAFEAQQAGWAKPGSQNFADPRTNGQGTLPADWGVYRGHYLDGNNVILSYGVGSAAIFELPGSEAVGEGAAISRTLSITGNSAPLSMQIASGEGAVVTDGVGMIVNEDQVTAVGVVAGGTLAAADNRISLTIEPNTKAVKVLIWHGLKADVAAFKSTLSKSAQPADLTPMTKGGIPRWAETVTVAGSLGSGDEAYVVDSITVPYENPYKCYMRTTGMDFLSDGRIAVCTVDGDVWIVSGIDDKLNKITWKRFASGMFQTLGLKIVNDVIYVTNRDRIIRLHDLNQDGEADYYENFNGDCQVTKMYHEFALGLERDKEGNFYYNKGANLGEATSEHQGCMLKISPDGKTMTRYATGLRAPNGIGGGDGYPLTNSDNQGNWMPACRVNLIKEGGFYGFQGTAHRTPKPSIYDQPICWIPMSADSSSGGQVWVSSDKWGPLKGSLLHMSYGKSALFILPFEEVDGVAQGGVVRIPVNFASSAMRGRFSPFDGQLYLTGMRGWQTNAVQEGCLHRVRYTGKTVTVPNKLTVTKDGVTITFPVALDATIASDKDSYSVERWNYRYTSAYGSADYKVSNPGQQGRDKVEVTNVKLSADNKSVTIQIADLKPVMQQSIKFKIATADGTVISNELFHSIHVVK
jgi:PA14 domain